MQEKLIQTLSNKTMITLIQLACNDVLTDSIIAQSLTQLGPIII